MRGCGFGKISGEEYTRMFLEEFDKMSLEEKETIRNSKDKRLMVYADAEKKFRTMTTKLRRVR